MKIDKCITVPKFIFDKLHKLKVILITCKWRPDFIEFRNKAPVVVGSTLDFLPYCSSCYSGEYVTSKDGKKNCFCGQCGESLDWSAFNSMKKAEEELARKLQEYHDEFGGKEVYIPIKELESISNKQL